VSRYDGNGASDTGGVQFTSAKAGSPLSFHSAGMNDLVTVHGITTSKGAALAAGIIREEDFGPAGPAHAGGNGQGQGQPFQAHGDKQPFDTKPVTNKPQEELADADPNTAAANSERPVPLDNARDEQVVQQLAARIDPSDSFAAFRAAMTGGEISDDLAAKIGTQIGVNDLDRIRSHAKDVEKAFATQATAEVSEPVLAWARAERMPELRQAASEQFSAGTLRGYNKLANDYYTNLDRIAPDQILNSADGRKLNARQDKASGEVLLDIPGVGTITYGGAVKAGLIGPHHGGKRGQRIAQQVARNASKRK
jgi:hypothetical protein